MKTAILACFLLPFLSACSVAPATTATSEADCKTHARKATYSAEADQEGFFVECMHLKGGGLMVKGLR